MAPLLPLVLASLVQSTPSSPPPYDGSSHEYGTVLTTRHFEVATENSRILFARLGSTDRRDVPGTVGLWPEYAIEMPDGTLWIIASDVRRDDPDFWRRFGTPVPGALRVFRAGATAPPRAVGQAPVLDGGAPRLGLSAAGDLGIAWVDRGEVPGELRLRLAWIDTAGHVLEPREIDRVALPPDVAALSRRTGLDVALAPHGEGLAVLWRPLRAPDRHQDTGDGTHPPEGDFPAEIRIVEATHQGTRLASRYDAIAGNVGAYTGHGPWPLRSSQAQVVRLKGKPVFVWYSRGVGPFREELLGARPGDARPTVLDCDSSRWFVNGMLPARHDEDPLLRPLLTGAAQVECPPPDVGR